MNCAVIVDDTGGARRRMMGCTTSDLIWKWRIMRSGTRGSGSMRLGGYSLIRKHSATLHGHRTSFSLEDEFWSELKTISADRGISLASLIAEVDDLRTPDSNLSSALRLHVLSCLRQRLDGKNT